MRHSPTRRWPGALLVILALVAATGAATGTTSPDDGRAVSSPSTPAEATTRTATTRVGKERPTGPREILGRARELETDGDLRGALSAYANLVETYPRSRYPDLAARATARVNAGEIHLRLGETASAARHFLDVLDLEPPSPVTERARFGLGTAFLWEGDVEAAGELFQEVVAAAEGEGGDADAESARRARDRLTLIHRSTVRPAIGQRPWRMARRLALPEQELDDPIGVAVSEGQSLLIVDEGIDIVALYELGGDAVGRLPNEEVGRPWWGGDGIAYLPTKEQGVFPLGRSRQEFTIPVDGEERRLEELFAGVRGPLGEWFLLDTDLEAVLQFSPDGAYERRLWGGDGSDPVDVAIDDLGRLYVLDREVGGVVRLTRSGETEETLISRQWDRAEAITVDALGNVYVLDHDRKIVYVYDREGAPITQLGPVIAGEIELDSPRDIDVDPSGRIFIADRDLAAVVVVE